MALLDYGTQFVDEAAQPARRHYTFTVKLDGPTTARDAQALARVLDREGIPADATLQFAGDRIYAYWAREIPPK